MAQNLGVYQAKSIEALTSGANLANRVNTAVHPFFGIIMTDDTGTIKATPATLKTMYEDLVPRELGISREIIRNNRVLKGLANPGEYLLNKNEDLQRIGQELSLIFATENAKQMNLGKSVEESKKVALAYAKSIEEFKMREHNDLFPTELTGAAVERFKRRNESGNLL